VHLEQANRATGVDKAIHTLEATREFANAFVGFGTPAAVLAGRPNAAIPEEALPFAQRSRVPVRPSSQQAEAAAATVADVQLIPEGAGKVAYGFDDLSYRALEYRRSRELWGPRNVAVYEYTSGDETRYLTRASERGEGHAEILGWNQLRDEGITPEQVTRVYSELQPCTGLPGGSCGAFLNDNFPNAQISYSFEYGATKASREAGKRQLLDTLARERTLQPTVH
jgi:hypothetical protein